MGETCPQCGSAAKLLFNLVACVGTGCRNYEEAWHIEWQQNNQPRYRHHAIGSVNNIFLGNFTSTKGAVFDLYCGDDGNGNNLALARAGNDNSQCFYVDEKETEVGTLSTGPIKSFSPCVAEALKMGLKRLKGMKRKPVTVP